MNAQPDQHIRIPLGQLDLSPRNARKTVSVGVEDLAASIAAHGLLQNLTVQPSDNDDGSDFTSERFGVVAGGRRLAALQLLARRGELPADLVSEGIPCRLIHDDNVALEASTAENTLREAMHPADQFDAFHAMIETGKPIDDVAAHFGVAPLVVKQRLKLANVNPQLVQIYREGGMSLEQLQALALTDNHEAQRQVWLTAQHDWERSPRDLREKLTRKEVRSDDALAMFVGLEAYEAAGGSVRRDLFSTRGEAWLQDKALLDRLALDKLDALAKTERDAGWSWAEARITMDYGQVAEYPTHPGERDIDCVLTAEQEKRVEAIDARLRELDGGDDDNFDDDWFQDEYSALEAERDEIHALAQTNASAEFKAATGVLVFLSSDGVQIKRGRLKPGQTVDKAGAIRGTPKAAEADTGGCAKPKKQELSAAVLMNLSAYRSEAAREHVRHDPQLALALLLDSLLASHHQYSAGGNNPLRIHGQAARNPISGGIAKDAPKFDLAAPDFLTRAPRKDRITWLIQQEQGNLLLALAFLLANHFDGITDNAAGHDGIAALHTAIGFDMADHWNAGCDNFLARIPAALVSEAVTEAKGKDIAATLNGLKKDELVAQAGKLLAGTGWLPKPLRGPGYALKAAKPATAPKPAPKKATAKAKPAKPAKKATPKKVAKKKPAKTAAKKKARA
jgi:ParB family chromosome partitioning protein